MKKVLIHSQNSSFTQPSVFPVQEQINMFETKDFEDVDEYIHQVLSTSEYLNLLSKAEVVFIKLGLSENYLEYYGLRVAYHIRLSLSLSINHDVPIVLIGEESVTFIGLTTDLSQILFTNGIYLIKESKEDFVTIRNNFNKGYINSLNDRLTFINKIFIKPPANYLSNHSIDNEYGILNWAKTLNINSDPTITQLTRNIEQILYYKYLNYKDTITKKKSIKNPYNTNVTLSKKVLYIDDEWDKGWCIILKKIFKNSNHFKSLETTYKTKKQEEVINNFTCLFTTFDPDIVILDLRLVDDDFSEETPIPELTGIKILKHIKAINPGIQVVIFSATNKIWNLIELQNENVDGFLLKVPPSNLTYEELIKKFTKTINDLQEETFKKELINKFHEIERKLKEQQEDSSGITSYDTLLAELLKKNQINIVNVANIKLNTLSTLDIAFLVIFNFLETFKNYYYENKPKVGDQSIDFKVYSNQSLEIQHPSKEQFNSWSSEIVFLYYDYFKIAKKSDKSIVNSIFNIAKKRNDFIHNNLANFDVQDLKDICKLTESLINKIDI